MEYIYEPLVCSITDAELLMVLKLVNKRFYSLCAGWIKRNTKMTILKHRKIKNDDVFYTKIFGKQYGIWMSIFEDDVLSDMPLRIGVIHEYKNDKLHGLSILNDYRGHIWRIERYKNGLKHGNQISFDHRYQSTYTKYYYENGILCEEYEYHEEKLQKIFHHSNGHKHHSFLSVLSESQKKA